MIKILWYLNGIFLIILILSNNPKAEGLGVLGNQNQIFSNTRQANNVLESLTWVSIILFLCLTTLLAINSV
uniref:Probable protein-export membrane protein SecG n=1 Tax=Helminthora furcellata TaxID=1884666 RepID=A0A1G4NRB1_9FLOR|nr:hypothetical protein P8463_pgp089 [Helminthora furcellata]SCW21164.1 secG [Helminthora furcellata]SCW24024.1 secG [Helminthora furcellata]